MDEDEAEIYFLARGLPLPSAAAVGQIRRATLPYQDSDAVLDASADCAGDGRQPQTVRAGLAPRTATPPSLPADPAVWSWDSGRGGWQRYSREICDLLNPAYDLYRDGSGVATVSISADHVVDFGVMKQQRKGNLSRSRAIRVE